MHHKFRNKAAPPRPPQACVRGVSYGLGGGGPTYPYQVQLDMPWHALAAMPFHTAGTQTFSYGPVTTNDLAESSF